MIRGRRRDASVWRGRRSALLALAGVLSCAPAPADEVVTGDEASAASPPAEAGAAPTPAEAEVASTAARADPDIVVPGGAFGPVSPHASEADILAAVGTGQYEPRLAELGEGMCAPGGVLFPDSPDEISVAFVDSTRALVAEAVARREGRWRTAEGVRVGTTLAELRALNGAPLTLTGFNWDRGGVVLDYHGGALAHYRDGTGFFVVLHARPHVQERELVGDRDVSSDEPALGRYDVRVSVLESFWRVSRDSFDCELTEDGSLSRIKGR
ncbi:MAG: hypothetical protein ABFS34_03970 [Gemmatimonadota bacterium]